MIKKPQIKAIIFDIGDVLALSKDYRLFKHMHKGLHEYIAKKLNISVDNWFDAGSSVYDAATKGKAPEQQFLAVMAQNLDKRPKKIRKIMLKAYKKHFMQNKELYKFAYKLKKKGHKIAILSDQHPISKKALMPKKHTKKFDVVVVSCDVGTRKPEPEIYKMTLKKLRTKPQQTVFIDNFPLNLTPAKKLGIRTILFKNNKQVFQDLRKLGVKV